MINFCKLRKLPKELKCQTILVAAFFLIISADLTAQVLQESLIRSGQNPQGFILNKGQILDQYNKPNPAVKFLLNMPGLNVQLRANGFSYDAYVTEQVRNEEISNFNYKFHRIDIEFTGANPAPLLVAEQPGSDYLNFYTTSTPEKGITSVKHYAKVIYKDLYPGIDLVFISNPGSDKPVEYNFIVHPGADPSVIRWKYKGSDQITSSQEKIQIATSHGILIESIPMTYEYETGKALELNYLSLKNGEFSFDFKNHNKHNTLIIDPAPTITWATYYGGSSNDQGYSLKTDPSGNIYVTGFTQSSSGIATSGAYQTTYAGSNDIFILMFNASGSRIWATYYGGSAFENGSAYGGNIYDNGGGLVLDASNNIYITGFSTSTSGIASSGAYQTTNGGSYDAFLAKFSSSGTLTWSTYLGGSGIDMGYSVSIDNAGYPYMTGRTVSSSAIATSGAFQTTFGGGSFDAFIAKFSPSGSIVWCTYYGGSGEDMGKDICIDNNNNVYVTGYTASTSGIATSGAYQTTNAGSSDAFIVKFSSSGSRIWATYYGGTSADYGQGSAVDGAGNIYAVGYTASTSGIASTGAHQTTFGGGTSDGFIVKFNSSGAFQWGTYYGGSGADFGRCMTTDAGGNPLVTGYTASTAGIATTGNYQTTYGGGTFDGYVVKLNPSGVRQWATYFGGSAQDNSLGITTGGAFIYFTGQTASSGLATTGAFQSSVAGGNDIFLAKFQDQQPVVVTSATTVQPDTTPVGQGVKNKMIIGIKIYTQGSNPMARITGFSFDTAGTFNYSNITGTAKVFYTGNNSSFSSSDLFDSTATKPTAAFSITGNQLLDTGTVYFWLTFDVSNTANVGAYLDAKCKQVTWDSAGNSFNITPVVISPAGKIRITLPPKTLNSIAYVQPSTSYVYRNTTNNPVLRIDINITGVYGNLSLNDISVKADNSETTDVTNVKLFTTATTTFSTTNQLGNTTTFSGGTANFTGLNYNLPTGMTYIWVSYDIPYTAPLFDTVDARIPGNGINIGGLKYPVTDEDPTGSRIINTYTLHDCGIDAVISPDSTKCNGQTAIRATLRNHGNAALTSDTIRWMVNGVSQPPYRWTGSLSLGATTTVSIGSFTFASSTAYRIKVYTSGLMNGSFPDSFHVNDTAIKYISSFKPTPDADFTINDPSQCFKNHSFIFTNTSTIPSGNFTNSWDFGDGTHSTLASPLHSYSYLDTFTVKLVTTSSAGCKDSITKYVSLKPSPHCAFTVNDSSRCLEGNSFLFTNSSTGYNSNNWNFGDSTYSTQVNPTSKSYLFSGIKPVKLVISNAYGCRDSSIRNVYVRPQPVSNFIINKKDQCLRGNSFIFTNTSTGQSVNRWDFGDTSFSSASNPPAKSYLYTYTKVIKLVTTSSYGCRDSITDTIHIRPNPVSVFTINNPQQCLRGNSFVFTNNSTGQVSNFWNFGDTTTSALPSPPAKFYKFSGIKAVKLVVTNIYGCRDSVTWNVNVRPHPVSGFKVNDSDQCLKGNNFVFANTSSGQSSNKWDFGDSTYSVIITPPAKSYLHSGIKPVKLVTTNIYSCRDSIIHNVFIRPHPVSKYTVNDTMQCLSGNSFLFTNNSTGQTGNTWNFGDTTSSSLASPPAKTYLFSGIKKVKLVTINNYGCKDSITRNIYVNPHPVSGFSINDTVQCLSGNSFIFTNNSTGHTGSNWNFGDSTSSSLDSPPAKTYLFAGTKTIRLLTTSAFGCMDSITTLIQVNPNPVVYLGKDTTLFDNQSIILDAGPGYDSYLWSDNGTSRTITIDTNGIGLNTRLFWVKVIKDGCEGYDSINITFQKHVNVPENITHSNIRVYPNPARETIHIETGFTHEDLSISLNDLNGKCLKTIRINGSDQRNIYHLDLSDLSEGLYILNITGSRISTVKRIIINNQ